MQKAHRSLRLDTEPSRTSRSRDVGILLLLALGLLMAPSRAQAYLDAGTGSMILQVVVATVMGALFILRGYWQKLKDLFKGQSSDEPEPRTSSPSDDAG
jgi:hypothetical protein